MTFEVGKTYRTRGGGTAAVYEIDDEEPELRATHQDGNNWTHNLNGTWWCGKPEGDPRDLLPGAIEDAGGGEAFDGIPTHTKLPPIKMATPEPDTKWDRDARAALTGLVMKYGTEVSPEAAALEVCAYADALAAERARRGEVG
jgi:hypothetical protein